MRDPIADPSKPLFYQLTIMAALEGIHVYGVFLPSVAEIRNDRDHTHSDRDVRQGEILSSTVVLVIAATMAGIVESSAPIIASVVVTGLMALAYEYALNTR